MKILILGAGKMGSFFCDLLSFDHEVAIYDPNPQRLRYTFNALRFASLDEVDTFAPRLVINASTVKYTIEAFNAVMPHLPSDAILSDIASVKTGLPEFYAGCGHPFVSTHPMFGPTFASLSNLRNENAIIISEGDHLGKVFFRDLYSRLGLNIVEYTFEGKHPVRITHKDTLADFELDHLGALAGNHKIKQAARLLNGFTACRANAVAAHPPNLVRRLLAELTIAHAQLSRHRQRALPPARHRRVFRRRIGATRPSDHQTPACSILKGLRCVEIKAGIDHRGHALPGDLKTRRLPIGLDKEPHALMRIAVTPTIGRHTLRTANENKLAIKLKQIRALPHKAKLLAQLNARRIAPDP